MTNKTFTTHLSHRGLIRVGGPDRLAFLQGLVSNDVTKVTNEKAVYAAMLTPQGKFLHDLFIIEQNGAFLVDCEAARAEDLLRRLTAYKLRAKVTFDNFSDRFAVWAAWGEPFAGLHGFVDPRLSELGQRLIRPQNIKPEGIQIVDLAAYDMHRIILGVADGSRDLEIEKSTLAEANFDYLNGIDWKKGCYVGQELTARMHYRGLAKKRLFPVKIVGHAETGMPLLFNAIEVGTLRSLAGGYGLALLTIDAAQNAITTQSPLAYGNAVIMPHKPNWLSF